MNNCRKYILNIGSVIALAFGGVFLAPVTAEARTGSDISVKVTVNVHGSDVGVSQETIEHVVDQLLEEAHIAVVEGGASSASIELQIDIVKESGHFKIDADWDDDPTPEAEETCETQDQIDDIVTEEVHKFIAFIKEKN